MERKWHEKTWVIILLTVVVWPVGIFLFFKNPYYSKNVKMGAIGLCAAIFAFAALTSNSGSNETKTVATTQQNSDEVKEQEKEKQRQREQEERERAEKEAAERKAQEERRKQEEIKRKEREKSQNNSYTEINIATLMGDLKANAARANKKYNDKNFKIVGGVVEEIESEGDYVVINTPNFDVEMFWSKVQCFPKTDLVREQIFNLNKNQRVTVYGKITHVGETLGYDLELMKIE